MASGIYRAVVVAHAPRMGKPEIVPEFQKDIVQGISDLGADIRRDRPDAIVICSTHYVSTFNWHVSTQARHRGHCVAMEAPDMISGEPYDYPGDPALARAILDEVKALGHPVVANATEHYVWDYGTWLPIHYMDPEAGIPVISMPVVVAADLEETHAVGRAVDRACRKAGRRAVFAASTSFSHQLRRGPELWPSPERVEADRNFIAMLLEGRVAEAWRVFPQYNSLVVGEMGGRALAMMLGTLADSEGARWETAQFGPYAPSSASGNANVSLKIAA